MKEIENGYYFENDNVKMFITKKPLDAKDGNHLKRELITLGFNSENLKSLKQVHGNSVEIVDNINNNCSSNEKDALVTNFVGVPLLIYTADCVPIIFFDENKKVVGLAHAGWQGTFKKIAVEVLSIFENKYSCEKENIHVIIGPHISAEKYEVSKELIEKFSELNIDNYYSEKNAKYYLNLSRINIKLLEQEGVPLINIKDLDLCTVRDNNHFYSFRKDNKTNKRIGTIIELK